MYYIIMLQCDEILGIIQGDDNINKWMGLLIAGKVHRICGLSVDGATDGERNIVNNNLRLTLTPATTLLEVLENCDDIPCQHLSTFVTFNNVSSRLRSLDNVIGKNK